MHHQRMWTSSLAVIPQTLSLPPACVKWKEERVVVKNPLSRVGHTHTVIIIGKPKHNYVAQSLYFACSRPKFAILVGHTCSAAALAGPEAKPGDCALRDQ